MLPIVYISVTFAWLICLMSSVSFVECRHLKIIGGIPSDPHVYPWQVYLIPNKTTETLICGASLINHQWILTAAHCMDESQVDEVIVMLGVHKKDDISNKELGIQEIKVHPNYNENTSLNDIALIKLVHPVEFTNKIQPISLPKLDDKVLVPNRIALVIGWGFTNPHEDVLSNVLREVWVPIVSKSDCIKKYKNNEKFHFMTYEHMKSVICAGKYGKDPCQGDSGGPLMISHGTKTYQYGIVSGGEGCANYGYPGFLTRVSHYCDWIGKTINNNQICVEDEQKFPDDETKEEERKTVKWARIVSLYSD